MSFTKAQALVIHNDLLVTLQAFAAKHNLNLIPGRGKFDAAGEYKLSNATFKVRGAASNGLTLREKMKLKEIGLAETDIGKKFNAFGEEFVLTGVKTNRPKYPLILQSVLTGKMHKGPAAYVRFIHN